MRAMRNQRKARKPHRCAICGRTISKGAEYIEESQWENDRIYTDRLHIHCDAVYHAYLRTAHTGKATGATIRRWIKAMVCDKCPLLQECDEDNIACQLALRKLLPSQYLDAASNSAKEVFDRGKPTRRPW